MDNILNTGDIGIKVYKETIAVGKDIRVELQNNTESAITIENPCPHAPLEVFQYTSEGFKEVTNGDKRNCDNANDIKIEPGKKTTISLQDYSYTLFGVPGRYKVSLSMIIDGTEKTYTSTEFTIKEPGIITKIWRKVLYQPILNALVALLIYIPKHNLALAVIVLTLLVRTILLIPSQRAIKAQKSMAALQPELEAVKKKYAHDQARLAQETMALWKKHKIHPLSSCVPLLIQMPILIALYYTIRTGLQPDQAHFIYDFLPSFELSDINPYIFNFNLLNRSIIVLPIIIGGLQFLQMQMMTVKQKKTKKDSAHAHNEMEMANNMMKYMMPVMIAFFTAQMPAAVGLYWGTSTLYGIIQQLVINKEGTKNPDNQDSVKVRVINKHT